MEEKKIWEMKINNLLIHFNNIEDFFKYLDESRILLDFSLKNKLNFNELSIEMQYKIYEETNTTVPIIITDEEHPIVLETDEENSYIRNIYINPTFFENNKNAFIEYCRSRLRHPTLKNQIVIQDFILDDKLFEEMLNFEDDDKFYFVYYMPTNKELTEEQIKAIIEKNIRLDVVRGITRKSLYLIGNYPIKYAKNTDYIDFVLPLENDEEIEKFIYINELATIEIKKRPLCHEEVFLEQLNHLFEILKNHNKNYNIKITVEDKEKLKESNLIIPSNINLTIENEIKYTKITLPIKDEEISKLKDTEDGTYINVFNYFENNDESEFYKHLNYVLNSLKNHNKKYTIIINVKNREKLRKSNLIPNLPSNITLKINTDYHTYDLEQYLKEEEILENLVAPIRNSNLSPLEKYLAAYNITKQFKKYKGNPYKAETKYLNYILFNKYITV